MPAPLDSSIDRLTAGFNRLAGSNLAAQSAEQIALADTASKRVTQAMADAAEVLTPAQRQKIAEHMKQRGERRPFWHRG